MDLQLPDRLTMPAEEYHRHPAVGSGGLKKILRSPAHYKQELDHPSPQTEAQGLGALIHLAVLEPERFERETVICPKFEGRGSRAALAEWEQEHAGKIIVKPEEKTCIEGVLGSIAKHRTARMLLADGRAEESFFWQDPVTGLVCKARPDIWKEGLIVDLKSTLNGSPAEFPRQVANLFYHLQGAYYVDGVSAVLGEPIEQFAIVAVEKTAPFAVATYALDEATLDVGRMLYRQALRTLRKCKMSGQYPGYPDRLMTTSLPSWAWPAEATFESDFSVRGA